MNFGNLMARLGLALIRKSTIFGFDIRNATELMRKYTAIYPNLARALGYSEATWTGKTINEATALNISTVWACQRVISETVASLPLHVFESTSEGKRLADEHPLDWVLYRETNPEISALRARQTMTAHCVIWGNAYALKVKRGGTGQTIGLWPWTPDSVTVDRERESKKLVYIHHEGGASDKTYPASDVFHLPGLGFDGVKGYSVVSMARQTLALASIQDEYAAKFFAQGGRKPYYLKKLSKFRTEADYEKFRDEWQAAYGGGEGFHKAPLLEGDLELHELGMPLEDAQLLASRQFSIPEICRWFRISPHLVGDLTHATFSNIEHLGLEFVQQTLMYWLCLWEQEIERQLFTAGEKGKYYVKHNVSALLRGDFKTRMEGYGIALQNGFMSRDEVRDLEDWNPMPAGAGKSYTIQLNMQTLPGTGEELASDRAAREKTEQSSPAAVDARKTASVIRDARGRVTAVKYGDPAIYPIVRDKDGRIAEVTSYGS